MLVFKYAGRDKKGSLKKGTIEAASQNDAVMQLRGQGISLREIAETKATIFNRSVSIGGDKVNSEHFVIYCRQFATLIRAGITIVEATNILANQTESKSLGRILLEIEQDLRNGQSFSQASEKHPKAFPPLFVNMVRAGELTGNLDETLEKLAVTFEKQHRLVKKIQSTMAYPVMLLVLIIGVVVFLMLSIIPNFIEMFEQFGSELPAITVFVVTVSEFIQSFWWLILLIVVGTITIFTLAYKRSEKFNYSVHVALLKMPIFGIVLQKAAIARMTRTLASLFSSAVPILEGLDIVSKVVTNPVISKVVLDARKNLEEGGTLSEPLEAHWVFPPIVYQMTTIGEETGQLDYMLDKVADFYEEDVDRTVDTLNSLIEPLMIVLLAFVVGFIVMAIMIPMFSVFTEIG